MLRQLTALALRVRNNTPLSLPPPLTSLHWLTCYVTAFHAGDAGALPGLSSLSHLQDLCIKVHEEGDYQLTMPASLTVGLHRLQVLGGRGKPPLLLLLLN